MVRKESTQRQSGEQLALVGVDPSDRYTMRISRLTIDKLGIKLYDKVSAVLAELVANAYDADAQNVEVDLPWGTFLAGTSTAPDAAEIVIIDDGHGMTSDEVNEHYLSVGSDRRVRTGSDKSREKNRPVMGRKGIGKLAPFGICHTIEVITAGSRVTDRTDHGWPVSHLILRLEEMLSDTDSDYHPQPGPLDGTWTQNRGTTIKLRDFQKKRVPTGEELNRQLAARFGLARSDWRVVVKNNLSETSETFLLGSLGIDVLENSKIDVADRPVPFGETPLPVSGWIAYSKTPYKDETMAGVRIFARGKLVAQTRDFNVPSGFTGEFKLRSYLVGEVHADWLDDSEDLVRSDRQDIIWSSDLGEALTEWGRKLIKEVAARSDEPLKKQNWTEFTDTSKIIQRLDEIAPNDEEFRESVIDAAKLLVDKKDREAVRDPDHADRLMRLAFSLGPHRRLLRTLRDVAEESEFDLELVMDLFNKARIAEMYSLGQVASERLAVVDRLEALVADGTTLERPLQELIEQAPWLLAPEWTPLGMNESLNRVRASFEAWYKKRSGTDLVTTAVGTPRREPDFVLLNDSGVLWIVEIKRMNYHLTDAEYRRAMDYLAELTIFLDENPLLGAQFPGRRLTFVVDHIDRLSSVTLSSLESDRRVDRRTWHELLDSTKRAHRDFLKRVEHIRTGVD